MNRIVKRISDIKMNGIQATIAGFIILLVGVNTAFSQNLKRMTLRSAVQYALNRNLDIKQSRNRVTSSALSVNRSKAAFYPGLSASISTDRQYGKTYNQVDGSVENQSDGSLNAGLSSGINLFNGFYDISSLRKAEYEYHAAEETCNYQVQSVVYETVKAFIQVVRNRELIGISKENLENQRAQLERIEALYTAGSSSITDLFQQRADIAQVELNLINAEREYEVSVLSLLKIMGIQPEEDVEFAAPALEPIISRVLQSDIQQPVDSVLSQRADISAQQFQIRAAEQSIQSARSGLLPTLSLSGSLGTSYRNSSSPGDFSDQFFDVNPSFSVGLTMSIPLFDRSQTKTSVEEARIQLSNEQFQVEQQILNIHLEIEQARVDFQIAVKQREVAQVKLEFTGKALEASQARYDVGSSTYTELSQVRAQHTQAAGERVQADWNLVQKFAVVLFYKGNINLLLDYLDQE